jgi:RimJ/RimL family protein N-acetyltransferase
LETSLHKLLLILPTRINAERLYLRPYHAGDGIWYYAMSRKNRVHLERYESDNPLMALESEEAAEILVRELANAWITRECFFMGAFIKQNDDFAAQVYVGPVNWELPEFQIGYFADVDHQGQGYVSEALTAALRFIFKHLKAHRVRLECDESNERSWRVAERCGMVREGYWRENKLNADGTYNGTVHYGMLQSEFKAL